MKLIFARGGGNLNKPILNSSIPKPLRGGGGGGDMLKLRTDRRIASNSIIRFYNTIGKDTNDHM